MYLGVRWLQVMGLGETCAQDGAYFFASSLKHETSPSRKTMASPFWGRSTLTAYPRFYPLWDPIPSGKDTEDAKSQSMSKKSFETPAPPREYHKEPPLTCLHSKESPPWSITSTGRKPTASIPGTHTASRTSIESTISSRKDIFPQPLSRKYMHTLTFASVPPGTTLQTPPHNVPHSLP